MSEYLIASDGRRARTAGPWTFEKLAYLRKYARAFATAMSKKKADGLWGRVVFIDPLCGPGIDRDKRSQEEFHGSPLLALETEPPFDKLYLGDLDDENVTVLGTRIAPADRDRVSLDAADCHKRVSAICQDMGSRAVGLAFVDPEGFEVHFELFETLSRRPVDIVFLFPSGIGIVRNLSQFVQQSHCGLDDLWGERSWRQLPMAKMAAGQSPTNVAPNDAYYASWALEFCKRVATLGYEKYDVVGPLRNEQNAPMYHLLFFSKIDAGLKIWKGIGQISPRGQRRLGFGD